MTKMMTMMILICNDNGDDNGNQMYGGKLFVQVRPLGFENTILKQAAG